MQCSALWDRKMKPDESNCTLHGHNFIIPWWNIWGSRVDKFTPLHLRLSNKIRNSSADSQHVLWCQTSCPAGRKGQVPVDSETWSRDQDVSLVKMIGNCVLRLQDSYNPTQISPYSQAINCIHGESHGSFMVKLSVTEEVNSAAGRHIKRRCPVKTTCRDSPTAEMEWKNSQQEKTNFFHWCFVISTLFLSLPAHLTKKKTCGPLLTAPG